MRLDNLAKRVFGKLKVLKRGKNYVSPNGKTFVRWLCQCECGKKKLIRASHLKSRFTTSCGCLSKNLVHDRVFQNLIGKRYGRLLVIKRSEDYINPQGTKYTRWLCKCDCGKKINCTTSRLNNGSTKSCGCLKFEMKPKKDIKNIKFGLLTALEYAGKSKWLCKCDCGNIILVFGNNLTSENSRSCGCTKESSIATKCKKYFSKKYFAETEYKVFKNKKTGHYLPYDIYIPYGKNSSINGFYIEIHGLQHYLFIKYFHKKQQTFLNQKKNDRLKKNFSKKNGTYIEIDLRKIKTVEEAIKNIEEILKEVY